MPTPNVIPVAGSESIREVAGKVISGARSVVIILADVDQTKSLLVRSFLNRCVLPIVAEADSVILDDGGQTGCAHELGLCALEEDVPPTMIGITTATQFDPNHTHILQLKDADTIKWIFQFASAVAGADAAELKPATGTASQESERVAGMARPEPKPVVLLIFGGKAPEQAAALRAARKGVPIVLIGDTGGISDEILTALRPPASGSTPVVVQDPVMREIVESGVIYGSAIADDVDVIKRILSAQLQKSVESLSFAWKCYEELDQAACFKQTAFRNLQRRLLVLAVLATLLAIASKVSLPWQSLGGDAREFALTYGPAYRWVIKYAVILVPLSITLLTAINSRLRAGNKWIVLRATAEGIKREIFRYRAQAGIYSGEQCKQVSRETKLAANVKDITESMIKSEVNRTSIDRRVLPAEVDRDAGPGPRKRPTAMKFIASKLSAIVDRIVSVITSEIVKPTIDQSLPPGQAGDSFLTPDRYIATRVYDQINYYVSTTRKLNKQFQKLHVGILLAGAAGTFLAAVGFPLWVAFTTALAAAWTTKLEIDQTENSLVQYNIALTTLGNIASWWNALSPWERRRRRNIDLLVDQTEKTLEGELAGWVQQMQSTLEKLTEKEDKGKGNTFS
jgi:hypothetical protein